MELKRLPLRLRKNDHDYKQVRRGMRSCVYEQKYEGRLIGWEVFLIKVAPKEEIHGYHYPDREVYPCDEDFGYKAWTFRDYDRAIERFDYLESQTDSELWKPSMFWNMKSERPILQRERDRGCMDVSETLKRAIIT